MWCSYTISLGLLLFELATDKTLPPSGKIWHALREGRAKEHLPDNRIGADMERLILDLLHPDPEKRPTASQLLHAIISPPAHVSVLHPDYDPAKPGPRLRLELPETWEL